MKKKSQIYECSIDEHNGEAIIGYCLNLECKMPPQCCLQCLQNKHQNHMEDCKGLKSITQLLNEFIKESQLLEIELIKLIQQVEKAIDNNLTEKWKKLKKLDQWLKEQNYDELELNLQLLKSQYQKNKFKSQKELDNKNGLLQQFADLCKQQKFILSSFDINTSEQCYIEGMALMKKNQWKDAIQMFDQLLAADSKNCNVISQKGKALWKLQKFNEAQTCIDYGLQINPNHINLNIEKGNVLTLLNDHQQAQKYFDKAIQLNPLNAQAYLEKGASLANSQLFDSAIAYLDKAIELDPNLALAYNYHGGILARLQQHMEAVKQYEKAIQLDPQLPMAYCNKGISLHQLMNYDEAIISYNQAINLNPNYSSAYKHKGISLESLKQYSKAIECYNLAVQKGYEPKKELQQMIQKLKPI